METIARWIAFHLPRCLIYWTTIRLIAYTTQDKYSNTIVPELGAMDALQRWEDQ